MGIKVFLRHLFSSGAALAFIMAGMVESAHGFPNQINEHEEITPDKFQNNLDQFLETGDQAKIKPKKKKHFQKPADRAIKAGKKAANKKRAQKLRSDLKKLQVRAIQLESEIQKLRHELEKSQNSL